jgi:hypothetical protein
MFEIADAIYFTDEEEKSGLRKRMVSESSSVRSEEEIPVAAITATVSKKVLLVYFTCKHVHFLLAL